MKRKPNRPKQEPMERPGSWESTADPGGAAGGGSPGDAGAADSGTSGQSVQKSKFRQKSQQEQTAASKLRMEKRGEKLEAAKDKLAKQLGISEHQLSYITHSNSGEGLLFYGDVTIPFVDRFPKGEIYNLLTTRPEDLKNEAKTE